MNKPFTVAGIGELLWDVFPQQRRLGGAPANFAFHCGRLGANAYPVSQVGTDASGAEIRAELGRMGVNDSLVLRTGEYPTGTVLVTLSAAGAPSYEIREEVAWDFIPLTDDLVTAARTLDAACFGSLAQRSPVSRATIRAFVKAMPDGALKIFDVNLRAPFFSMETIAKSLQLATILKLSDEELPVLATHFGHAGSTTDQLAGLREQFDLELVAYTRGAKGSVLLGRDEVDDAPGVEVLAMDSVGAGDSFTAALCMGLLKGGSLHHVNRFANQVARYVCTQPGATPTLPPQISLEQEDGMQK